MTLLSCGMGTSTSPTLADVNFTGRLEGIVSDDSSLAPVASASVEAQGQRTTTGTDGHYVLSGLTSGPAQVTARHQGHQNVTQAVTLVGEATILNIPMTPDPAAGFVGAWAGQWTNTTFGTTGSATMAVSVDTIVKTFEATLDLDGAVFGGPDPPAETFRGSYTSEGVHLSVTSPSLGDVTLSMTPDGAIGGLAINVPGGAIARVRFTGTATASTVAVTYTITFMAGGTAQGVVTLNKQS